MSKNMHLTLDERNIIEQELNNNSSFRKIAILLDKDPTTIAKEVKKHKIRKEGQAIHIGFNSCSRKYNCNRRNVCGFRCNKKCSKCNICNKVCSDFEDGICLRLKRAPYVCNGCSNKYSCKLTKYYYKALSSHKIYRTLLSEARQGINTSEIDLPRKVRFKKRKQKHIEHKDTKARLNRTYEDFKKYTEQYPDIPIVEMDTVEGIKGGRVLLT